MNQRQMKYYVFLKDTKNSASYTLGYMLDIISTEYNKRYKSYDRIDWKLVRGIIITVIIQIRIH
jgi:hypothetical protein